MHLQRATDFNVSIQCNGAVVQVPRKARARLALRSRIAACRKFSARHVSVLHCSTGLTHGGVGVSVDSDPDAIVACMFEFIELNQTGESKFIYIPRPTVKICGEEEKFPIGENHCPHRRLTACIQSVSEKPSAFPKRPEMGVVNHNLYLMTSTRPSVAQTAQAAPVKPRIARPRLIVAHLSARACVVSSFASPTSAAVSTVLVVAKDAALACRAMSVGCRKRKL